MQPQPIYETQLGDRTIHYRIRESNRVKYVKLTMHFAEGIEIVIPTGYVLEDHEEIIHSRARWIIKHLKRMEKLPPPRKYQSGEKFPFLGQDYVLDVRPGANKSQSSVKRDGDKLIVKLPQGLTPDEQPTVTRNALEKWLRREAKQYMAARVRELAQQHGFEYGRITIRAQKTRWGSCSASGNLNFNLRLMMAPPLAIDYLILHELAHLRQMNHSTRFWQLVERMFPDYQYWRQWLNENSSLLYV
jgi:predicted metal-dependent hydrolase